MANQYSSELTDVRALAVKVMSRGHGTVNEVANALGLGRQTVQHWADVAGIDIRAARQAAVQRAIERARPRARTSP